MGKPVAEEKWWQEGAVAVVTGANKGIGFEIARQLGREGLHVVATSRDEGRGREAIAKLEEHEPKATFTWAEANISDAASVQKCADLLKEKFGKVTILVNNAGMAFKGDTFGADEAKETLDTNLKGTRAMCEAVIPLMESGARIVNVCSMASKLSQLSSDELKKKFLNPASADDIEKLAYEFPAAIRDGTNKEKGWGSSMYGISKLAETSYTLWLARQLEPKGIMVNAVCPGYVNTDMTSGRGTKAVADGADTPVWTALLPPGKKVTGHFFQEREEWTWDR